MVAVSGNLTDLAPRGAEPPRRVADEPAVAFAFTGQGCQHPRMTAGLYEQSALYRRHLDEASLALLPHTGMSVGDLVLGGDVRIHQTGFTQPALFAVEYALARTVIQLGVRPCAVVGHSVGEFAAAVVAGALELADAARLVAVRGALMQYLPSGGGMLATRAAAGEVAELIAGEPLAGIGAVNGPGATVLSGDLAALDRIRDELDRRGLRCTPLQVSHAFHSPLMAPMLDRFGRVAARVPAAVPALPFHSTVRGRLLAPGEKLDGAYWVEHVSATVRFGDAVESLFARPPTHVLEVGPKPLLSSLVRRIGAARGTPTLNVCRNEGSGARELAGLLARLYEDGLAPAWEGI